MPFGKGLLLAASVPLLVLSGCTGAAPAETRILVDFPAPHADIEASVTLEEIRQAAGTEPISAFHQLQAWSRAAHVSIEVREFTFGHCLDRVDSLPNVGGCSAEATAYWTWAINGNR